MLTVNEVSERLKVSQAIVYALIERGKIGCHRIGIGRGTIRISEADLGTYLESCHSQVPDAPAPKRKRGKLKHIRL
jgi:excisionase family DNA binding protein